MKKVFIVLWAVLFLCGTIGFATEPAKAKSGEVLFRQYCSVCHPEGGNTINPQKTLQKKNLDANKIKKAGDIINKMRHPGPGMTLFDKKTVPDDEAKKIAEYILKTFK